MFQHAWAWLLIYRDGSNNVVQVCSFIKPWTVCSNMHEQACQQPCSSCPAQPCPSWSAQPCSSLWTGKNKSCVFTCVRLTRSKENWNNSHTNSCLSAHVNSYPSLTRRAKTTPIQTVVHHVWQGARRIETSLVQTSVYQLSSSLILVWPGAKTVKTTPIQTVVYQNLSSSKENNLNISQIILLSTSSR